MGSLRMARRVREGFLISMIKKNRPSPPERSRGVTPTSVAPGMDTSVPRLSAQPRGRVGMVEVDIFDSPHYLAA